MSVSISKRIRLVLPLRTRALIGTAHKPKGIIKSRILTRTINFRRRITTNNYHKSMQARGEAEENLEEQQ